MIAANELRTKYLEFFKSKGHAIIPSASLIPENDPTVLFNTAGMQSLVPYLMGESHPAGVRLTDVQKCVRTGDIDDVGDNRHLTFFEMLGNWSLGDYFKKEAIEWSFEFLTGQDWLGIDPTRLYVTVFLGNENSTKDEESIKCWQEQFAKFNIKAEVCPYGEKINGNKDYRIFPLPEDNWWGPAGETGPCGPCTEMFYDVAPEKGALVGTFDEEVNAFRVMEIWNDVFMEFNKQTDKTFIPLAKKNVDTGMGLERTIAVLNGTNNVFETEIFAPLFKKLEELSGKKYGESKEITRAMRIIADHLRATTFIIGDQKGITPSNVGAGYVLRRLMRRAIVQGNKLDIKNENGWTKEIIEVVINAYGEVYPEIKNSHDFIIKMVEEEEEKFAKTLENGLKEFTRHCEGLVCKEGEGVVIPGEIAFKLFATYGFPIELTKEIAKERGLEIDEPGFEEEFKKHQDLSRTASAGMFKGGLADFGEETKKLHSAAHLLVAALRKVLGEHVSQKGSNITAERLRFDFSHTEKMTAEQIAETEKLVNEAIAKDFPIICEEKSLDEAKAEGAMGVFNSKYGEKVKVYTMGDVSKEICGGPHASHTGELGHFKITKEESSSSGVRRIKAILE